MIYRANFSCNNGTTLMTPLCDTNKHRLAKKIRDWAKAECFIGNTYRWWVTDENGVDIMEGYGRG